MNTPRCSGGAAVRLQSAIKVWLRQGCCVQVQLWQIWGCSRHTPNLEMKNPDAKSKQCPDDSDDELFALLWSSARTPTYVTDMGRSIPYNTKLIMSTRAVLGSMSLHLPLSSSVHVKEDHFLGHGDLIIVSIRNERHQ